MKSTPRVCFTWRRRRSPSIKRPMTWICALSPQTCNVERHQKLFKAIRTKTRNLLGYLRAFGLNFRVSEETALQENWSMMMKMAKKIESLSQADLTFLGRIAREAAQSAQEDEEMTQEEVLATSAHAQVEAPGAVSAVDDLLAEEGDVQANAVRVSSFGRVIRDKVWS